MTRDKFDPWFQSVILPIARQKYRPDAAEFETELRELCYTAYLAGQIAAGEEKLGARPTIDS